MNESVFRCVLFGSALVTMASVAACAPSDDEAELDEPSSSSASALTQGPANYDDEAQFKLHCGNTRGCDPTKPGSVARRTTPVDAAGQCAPGSDTLTTRVTCGEGGKGTISWTYVRHVLVAKGGLSDGDGGINQVCVYEDKTWTGSYDFTCTL